MKGSTMSTNEPEAPVPRPGSEIGDAADASKRGPGSERADHNDGDCGSEEEDARAAEKTSLCVEVEKVRDPTAEHPS
jgi:hypothetical protein